MNNIKSATFSEIVRGFNTTPVLFIGSGFSKRYYSLPSWEELLKIFANQLSSDEFVLEYYKNIAESHMAQHPHNTVLLAEVATLIQKDFDRRWYADNDFRNFSETDNILVHRGTSPFKIAIANLIKNKTQVLPDKQEEINFFKEISCKSISSIITTNYDMLLETITNGYKTYVGQEELIFSAIQGYGEIYKIHGSVSDPNSILITSDDYVKFNEKSPYLTSKLMTIFMEYPIIFIGYSINDPNIKLILDDLGKCLSDRNLERLQNRFIYIEYKAGQNELEISNIMVPLGHNTIRMTGIKTDNFMEVYRSIGHKRATFPVKIIRMFKEELYTYTLTNKPTTNLHIAPIDDTRIDDERLVLAIARPADLALQGLQGITAEQWYRHILLDDIGYSADEILEFAYPSLISRNNILPLNKLLASAKNIDKNKFKDKVKKDFKSTLTNTIIKTRDKQRNKILFKNIDWILSNYKDDIIKGMKMISYLFEEEIELTKLENFLIACFNEQDFYQKLDKEKSHLHRLVFIYDYLKYGKTQPVTDPAGLENS